MNERKTFDIDTLKKRITLFKKLGKLSWILNIILLGLSFYQFVLVGYRFKIDVAFTLSP
jgi:hypothetical protein